MKTAPRHAPRRPKSPHPNNGLGKSISKKEEGPRRLHAALKYKKLSALLRFRGIGRFVRRFVAAANFLYLVPGVFGAFFHAAAGLLSDFLRALCRILGDDLGFVASLVGCFL